MFSFSPVDCEATAGDVQEVVMGDITGLVRLLEACRAQPIAAGHGRVTCSAVPGMFSTLAHRNEERERVPDGAPTKFWSLCHLGP